MNFENAAFLFDSTVLGSAPKSTVQGVISFVGNPLYISSYAKEALEKFDFPTASENYNLKEWLNYAKNEEAFAPFLIKLYDDIGKLGMLSFFIEKDYSVFVFLIGLMCNLKTPDTGFRSNTDILYHAYKSEYLDALVLENAEDTVKVFNERIHHIIQTQKNHHQYFQNLLKESGRSLDEQLSLVHRMNEDRQHDFIVADQFFYGNQIIQAYKEKEIHDIYATRSAAKRLEEVTWHFFKSANVTVSIQNSVDNSFDDVFKFARIVLMFSHYFIEKILQTDDIDDLSEEDKYMFVIIWMILQSGDNNLFVNNRSYELIKEVFLSIKKDMSV